jgi:hypothetical protein
MVPFFAMLFPTGILMEVCGSNPYWARQRQLSRWATSCARSRLWRNFCPGIARPHKHFSYGAENTAFRRTPYVILEAQSAEIELTLVDPSQRFDPGDGAIRGPEPGEAERPANPQLRPTAILPPDLYIGLVDHVSSTRHEPTPDGANRL